MLLDIEDAFENISIEPITRAVENNGTMCTQCLEDDFLQGLNDADCITTGYADDITIVFKFKFS